MENRNETVTIASVYDKTDFKVRWATTIKRLKPRLAPGLTRLSAQLSERAAGGGKGAGVGAAIGGGAGAGTVILQGRENLELSNGTEFTITATAPANVGK